MRRPRLHHVPLDRTRRTAGAFLHDFAAWNVWVTLTFRFDVQEPVAQGLVRALFRAVADGSHMWTTIAWGPQADGKIHFHALWEVPRAAMGDRESLDDACVRWRKLWPRQNHVCGLAEVEPFDASGSAASYMAEHPIWEPPWLVCPRPQPCRRRKGCVMQRARYRSEM